MSNPRDHLQRWQAAGLLDATTATAIAAYEDAAARTGESPQPIRVGLQEAFIYLGLGIAGAGAALLLGVSWEDLGHAGRLLALLIPALVATGVGAALLPMARPDLRRGGSVAWLVASGLFAGAAGMEIGRAHV